MALITNYSGLTNEAGCDEAGRGCLAGPVFAAAVILPDNFFHHLLNDSKQVSEKNRNTLRKIIEENALCWAVACVDNSEIDKINILNASISAMHKAIALLKVEPQYIIVDGNRFKSFQQIQHKCIVKGDALYASIAAASVLAKTHRDEFMLKIHDLHPNYDWKQNKGYPTLAHRKAVLKFGLTEFHRKTFKIKELQSTFDF